MNLTPRLQEAINHAARLHRNEVRKDQEQTPYFTHLVSVAILIANYTDNEDVLIAALLHDSIEDVPGITAEYIESHFGPQVAKLVQTVTEPKPNIEHKTAEEYWYEKKHAYLNQLSQGDAFALYIAAGDKIHNMRSMMDGYHKNGEDHLRKFVSGALEKQAWFYTEVEKILLNRLDSPILQEYRDELARFSALSS